MSKLPPLAHSSADDFPAAPEDTRLMSASALQWICSRGTTPPAALLERIARALADEDTRAGIPESSRAKWRAETNQALEFKENRTSADADIRAMSELDSVLDAGRGVLSPLSTHLLNSAIGIIASIDHSATSMRGSAAVSPMNPLRPAALDLLAADALITYAMEVAAENCETLEAGADAATRLICLLETHISRGS